MTEKKSMLRPMSHAGTKKVVLLYGVAGSGKTSLCTSLQGTEFGDCVLVDTDHGTGRVVPEGVLVTPQIETVRELQQVRMELATPPEGVKTLVVDGLPSITEMAFREVTKTVSSSLDSVVQPSQHTWTQRNQMAFGIFRAFLALPYRVIIFTAGETVFGDEGKPPRIKPGLSESLSDRVSHYIDHMFRLEALPNGKRRLHLEARGAVAAKSRAPTLVKKFGHSVELDPAGEPQTTFLNILKEL